MSKGLGVAKIAELAWGYTMDDIDRMSFAAARTSRSTALDFNDRQEVAWGAIVEMLYSSPDRPTWRALNNGASAAVSTESRALLRSHGTRAGEPGVGDANHRPKYLQYWLPVIGPVSDFTEKLIEREALPQILSELTPTEYETIVTLAAYGSQTAAAKALGLKRETYGKRLLRARMRLWQFWFEHETPPPRSKASATTCRNGHSKAEYSFVTSEGRTACRQCMRAASTRSRVKYRDDRMKLGLDN